MSASPQVTLEHLNELHTEALQHYASDERIAATCTEPYPYPPDGAQKAVQKAEEGRHSGTFYSFAITHETDFTGVCSLYWVDGQKQSADLAYWVAVPFWGRGLATEAVRQVLSFCRFDLNLLQIKSGVLERNPASRRVLEKNGFSLVQTIINTVEYDERFSGERFWQMRRLLS